MAASGMLTSLFGPNPNLRTEQQDDEQRLQNLAAMNPFQADAYASYSGARAAGRGLGSAISGALGGDARSPAQKNQQAIDNAKAQVAQLGFSPDDPKSMDAFYKNVIAILQKNQLVAEAMAVAHEWNDQKRNDRKVDLQNAELDRKKLRDTATDARAQERNKILEKKGALGAETLQLLNVLDNIDPLDPTQEDKRKALLGRLNALSAGKGVRFEQLGDTVNVVDANTGAVIRTDDVGARPMSEKDTTKNDQQLAQWQTKYDQTKLSLQSNYNTAAELYGMRGLKDAVGVVAGLISRGQVNNQSAGAFDVLNRARLSGPAQTAVAKIAQVQGQTFIAALSDLKASGNNGATGLGSLTEVEGAKIQNAKAALDPQQPYPSYRANLAQYMKQLELSSQVIDEGAKRLGLTTKPLTTVALGGPAAAAPAAPSASPAPAAPVAPAAPDAAGAPNPAPAPAERWDRVNGKLQKVGG